MGKRKGAKKLTEWDCADADDSASCASTGTMLSSLALGDEEDYFEDDPLQQSLDDLFEKRGSTREKAYSTIVSLFETNVRIEDCLRNETTIFSRCVNSVRKGGVTEAALAARCLGLHTLVLGPDAERGVQDVLPDLSRSCMHAKGVEVKVASIETLAIAAFVAVDDEDVAAGVLETLQTCWKQDSYKVKSAALRGWTFVLTAMSKLFINGSQVESALEHLASLLHDSNVEVRKAAGEAIAFVHQATGANEMDEDDWYEGNEAEADAMSESASTKSGLEEVVDRMQDLSKNRGDRQRKSKRDRVKLRTAFRDLCNLMETGEVRAQKVKLQHGDCLVVDTMEGVLQLNYLRGFLAGGFHAHMQANPLLHSVFNFAPLTERAERMSAADKRAYKSPSSFQSKARAQDRKMQRSFKSAIAVW